MLKLCCVSESALLCSGKMVQMKLLIWLSVYLWCLLDHGASGVDTEEVSVKEGDSVTLNTGVQTSEQDNIRWYYNDNLIARIFKNQIKICTDVQCKEGLRDRLKLDHQTGSLTIMNITDTHSGEYKLEIGSGSSKNETIFIVSVTEREGMMRKTVMKRESVTLNNSVGGNPNDVTWYFNEICIAEITGDQSQICTDVQCKERFRDRLKLDHQTGSLTIMNIRNTDTGEYTLLVCNSRFSIMRSFSVSVTDPGLSQAVPDPGLSSAAVGGICAAVILLVAAAAAAAGIYCYCKSQQTGNSTQRDDHHQENDVTVPLNQRNETPQVDDDSGKPQ